jgi:hypothetical protein
MMVMLTGLPWATPTRETAAAGDDDMATAGFSPN